MSTSHQCFETDDTDVTNSPDSLADRWVDDSEDKHGETPFGLSVDKDSFSLTADDDPQTRRGKAGSLLSGNLSYVFIGLMALTTVLQHIIFPVAGIGRTDALWTAAFVLDATNIQYVWTWFTSVFAHGGFFHFLMNAIVIFFFGPIVEKQLGVKKYIAFFLGAGAISGLAQVSVSAAMGGTAAVLGASGAGLAILGFVTLIIPNRTIYLMFVLPAPIWAVTALFAGASVLGFISGGAGAGGVAQVAHLAGLIIGLVAVYLHRDGDVTWPSLDFGNTGRGGI